MTGCILAVLDVCSPALARNWAASAEWLAAKNKWNWTRRHLRQVYTTMSSSRAEYMTHPYRGTDGSSPFSSSGESRAKPLFDKSVAQFTRHGSRRPAESETVYKPAASPAPGSASAAS
jgi:hypothetical protein